MIGTWQKVVCLQFGEEEDHSSMIPVESEIQKHCIWLKICRWLRGKVKNRNCRLEDFSIEVREREEMVDLVEEGTGESQMRKMESGRKKRNQPNEERVSWFPGAAVMNWVD